MLSHESLHLQTLDAARKEKSATLALLQFLKQIDERRTYAVLGYPSLFKYIEEGLGYSPAQASDRVSATRLLRRVPVVAEKLSSGEHTLTSIAKVASHVRRENLTAPEASALILETANQTIASLEKHLLGSASIEPPKLERVKIISQELTRLTFDVDEEFMIMVQRVRELKGNPALSVSQVFTSAMKEFIQKREVSKVTKTSEVTVNNALHELNKSEPNESTTSVAEVKEAIRPISATRYIRLQVRRVVRMRAQDRCEFVYSTLNQHPTSHKRCDSRSGLQFEHITPFAMGGANTEGNLKLYCPAHNRLSALQAYGREKMEPFLKL